MYIYKRKGKSKWRIYIYDLETKKVRCITIRENGEEKSKKFDIDTFKNLLMKKIKEIIE